MLRAPSTLYVSIVYVLCSLPDHRELSGKTLKNREGANRALLLGPRVLVEAMSEASSKECF